MITSLARLSPRFASAVGGSLLILALFSQAQEFSQLNLVTDDNTVNHAVIQDPNLVNAWGISMSATSPFWVSDNGSGVATLYRVDPVTGQPTAQPLVVHTGGAGTPTGQAFNPLAADNAFNRDNFLFVAEDGTISGWRGALGNNAETLQIGTPDNVYKGTAFANVGGHGYLLSANFKSGVIDVLKGDAGAPDLLGKFTDPNLPSQFAPFNIRNLGGKIFVTYAMQDAAGHDDVPGPGNGFVDAFDLQGNLLGRVASQGSLNSPWGLEMAPASFGALAGDLLVGNFGDGRISAFDLNNGNMFEGQVRGPTGTPLSIDGLWGITVGNDGNAGSSDKLYFSAGPNDESHGLFGVLQPVPEVGSTLTLLAVSLGGLGILSRRRPQPTC